MESALSFFRLAWLREQLGPSRRALLLALLLMLAESVAWLANPYLAGQFAGALLGASSLPSAGTVGPGGPGLGLRAVLLLWLALLALQAALASGHRYLVGRTSEELLARLRVRLYDHLQALPLAYHQERQRGGLLTLITHDAALVGEFVTDTLLRLPPQALTLAGALAFILWLDPLVAVALGALVPLLLLVGRVAGRRLRPLTRQMVEEHARTIAIAEENLALLAEIKSFTREPVESARFRASNERLVGLLSRFLRIHSLLGPATTWLSGTGILLLLWLTSSHFQQGRLDAPKLVSLLLYGLLLTRPVAALVEIYGELQQARGAAERLTALFVLSPQEKGDRRPALGPVAGLIEVEGVEFAYRGRAPALRGVSFCIHPGEIVGLTGPNGAGKTTLAHLLVRFADPDAGRIRIDGQDIREVSLASLRSQIGLVAQHVLLHHGTVAENIGFARPDATRSAIERAARAAGAHELIAALPDGYETVVGEQGLRLSGGQKQRVALARALLKDPPILLLDEATTMFDPAAEDAWLRDCRDILRGRTVIIISHRPATLAIADRLLRLEGGKLTPLATPVAPAQAPPPSADPPRAPSSAR